MNRPSIRELEYFVAVAEALHFSRAAKRLHLSQPPLSRQIQGLEEKLGIQLLKRKTRRVALTAPGRIFLEDAREVLYRLDRAVLAAQRVQSGENERLRFGFIGYLHAPALAEVLQVFRKARPRCQVELLDFAVGEMLPAIQEGKLHGGFIGVGPHEPLGNLKRFTWKVVHLVAVFPEDHRLARKEGKVSLSDLKEEHWVMPSRIRSPGFRVQIDDLCVAAGFRPRVVQESDSMEAVMTMIAAGTGIAVVSESVTRMLGRGLEYRLLAGRGAVLRRNFVWRADAESEALRAFNEVLRRFRTEAG